MRATKAKTRQIKKKQEGWHENMGNFKTRKKAPGKEKKSVLQQ